MKQILQNHLKTLIFCLGCLSALAMAPVYAWPLMLLGYAVFINTLSFEKEWKKAGTYSFLFFFGYFLTGLYWVSSSLFVEFDRWWWALPFSFAGLPFLLSLFPTLFLTIAFFIIQKKNFNRFFKVILITACLILADYARGHLFTGFPWNMPVHGWIKSDFIREALPYLTFYGINSLIIIVFGLTCMVSWKWRGLIILILTTTFFFPLNQKLMKLENNIIMVQANIPQKEKWKPEFIERNFNRYIDMSLSAVEINEPHIIIWPETAISQYLLENKNYQERFSRFLNNLPEGSILITGVLTYDEFGSHFNSLLAYNQSGNVIARYNKHHLVPFGEYMPFGLDTVTGFNNFQYGPPPKMIRLDSNIRFSFVPLICYESIFTHYSTITTDSGVLLNITNDSWFGNTAGPYQHFDHVRFRAAENKTMVLRLSGNGISAIISQHGNILLSSRLNTQDIVKNN